jgi:hypothetical protein
MFVQFPWLLKTRPMTSLKCCRSLVPRAGSYDSMASTVVEKFGYDMVLTHRYNHT